MNGKTTVLGSLYCSSPIDSYRLTCSEIRARDATCMSIATNTSVTSLQILLEGGVEILTPLSLKVL